MQQKVLLSNKQANSWVSDRERKIDSKKDILIDRYIDGQRERSIGKIKAINKGNGYDRQIDEQINRWIDRQIDRHI